MRPVRVVTILFVRPVGWVSVDDQARLDALLVVLEELGEANLTTPIVVEGKRDVASLRRLGCRGEVWVLHAGDPLFQVAEGIAAQTREVILLTDWDRKGGILFEQLRQGLVANGVRVVETFREKIPLWVRPPLKDVESLASYVERQLETFYRVGLEERTRRVGE